MSVASRAVLLRTRSSPTLNTMRKSRTWALYLAAGQDEVVRAVVPVLERVVVERERLPRQLLLLLLRRRRALAAKACLRKEGVAGLPRALLAPPHHRR